MRILVADDEPIHLGLMEATLKRWGHEVVTAVDGDVAWQVLTSDNPPGLVVLDWNMPGVDGLELIGRIRESPALRSLPVVLLSVRASTVSSDPRASLANHILVKPWSPREFRDVILTLSGAS